MPEARPLREIFDVLAGQAPSGAPAEPTSLTALLREGGHGDLPVELVAEALAGYATTAPLPVAEQLSTFSATWATGLTEDGAPLDPRTALDDGVAGLVSDAGSVSSDGPGDAENSDGSHLADVTASQAADWTAADPRHEVDSDPAALDTEPATVDTDAAALDTDATGLDTDAAALGADPSVLDDTLSGEAGQLDTAPTEQAASSAPPAWGDLAAAADDAVQFGAGGAELPPDGTADHPTTRPDSTLDPDPALDPDPTHGSDPTLDSDPTQAGDSLDPLPDTGGPLLDPGGPLPVVDDLFAAEPLPQDEARDPDEPAAG